MTSRRRIRQSIRQLRNTLSPTEQSQAADALVLQCATNPIIQKANTIAVYLSSDGEVDTDPLIKWLWQQGSRFLYLLYTLLQRVIYCFLSTQKQPHSFIINTRYLNQN